ncbi:MAG: lysophospholipid acyltransferase family protein [Myxococcota bacterium]|jgi:1-acyl-sn-glycerol-3-phosphate acyltransferase
MNAHQRDLALKLVREMLPPEEFDKIQNHININDVGFGYDQFGMEKESAILAYALTRYAYKYWFRVQSTGHENVPLSGRTLIVPNHSGVLPLDAVMIGIDLVYKLDKPRNMRAVVDNFMGFTPFLNTMMYRVGQVVGARRNFEDLLKKEEMVAVFPEGAKGTGKLFSHRYNLLKFNVGFIELSIKYKTPIVPTAVIGGEEQYPMIYNFKPLARLTGFPYFPVTPFLPWLGLLGAIPLPVKYHIRYGEPIRFFEDYGPEVLNDPETVRMLADKVQIIVQDMVNGGLAERRSIFGFGEE